VIIAATKRVSCVDSKFRHNLLAAGAPPDPKPNSWATSCKGELKGDHAKKEQKGEGTQRGMVEPKRILHHEKKVEAYRKVGQFSKT